jgi:hypothetical protein
MMLVALASGFLITAMVEGIVPKANRGRRAGVRRYIAPRETVVVCTDVVGVELAHTHAARTWIYAWVAQVRA